MNDPRKGKPSASSMHRTARCGGSVKLIELVVAAGNAPPETSDSTSGDWVHQELNHRIDGNVASTMGELSEFEIATVEACEELFLKACKRVFHDEEYAVNTEERHWFRFGDEEIFSGQHDRVAHDKSMTKMLIVDFKSLFGEYDAASDNWQLKALAVLMDQNFGSPSTEITVCLIQPNAPDPDLRITMALYKESDLDLAADTLMAVMHEASNPHAARIPGSHCNFCAARGECPEAQSEVMVLSGITPPTDPLEIAAILEKGKQITAIVEENKRRARALLEKQPFAIPGWTLKPGKLRSEVTDATGLFQQLNLSVQITAEEFTQNCKPTMGALKKLHKVKSCIKGKAHDETWKELISPYVEYKRCADELTREK